MGGDALNARIRCACDGNRKSRCVVVRPQRRTAHDLHGPQIHWRGLPLTLKNVIVLENPFRFTKDNIDQFEF
jgi:hypothetical protein